MRHFQVLLLWVVFINLTKEIASEVGKFGFWLFVCFTPDVCRILLEGIRWSDSPRRSSRG
jgi:hypothetical protein